MQGDVARSHNTDAGSPPMMNNYGRAMLPDEVAAGYHRDFVGGMWEEMGTLQLEFLASQGLRPDMRLLDVGCGALRGGLRFIEYLDPAHYFGIDVNESLITAGYDRELSSELRDRTPRNHLRVTDDFDASSFGVTFDVAIAQSVLTHLPLNSIRRCLFELRRCIAPSGAFFATFFEAPSRKFLPRIEHGEHTVTFADRDPYHYSFDELANAGLDLGWDCHHIGDWGHPKGQHMLCFVPRALSDGPRITRDVTATIAPRITPQFIRK